MTSVGLFTDEHIIRQDRLRGRYNRDSQVNRFGYLKVTIGVGTGGGGGGGGRGPGPQYFGWRVGSNILCFQLLPQMFVGILVFFIGTNVSGPEPSAAFARCACSNQLRPQHSTAIDAYGHTPMVIRLWSYAYGHTRQNVFSLLMTLCLQSVDIFKLSPLAGRSCPPSRIILYDVREDHHVTCIHKQCAFPYWG